MLEIDLRKPLKNCQILYEASSNNYHMIKKIKKKQKLNIKKYKKLDRRITPVFVVS